MGREASRAVRTVAEVVVFMKAVTATMTRWQPAAVWVTGTDVEGVVTGATVTGADDTGLDGDPPERRTTTAMAARARTAATAMARAGETRWILVVGFLLMSCTVRARAYIAHGSNANLSGVRTVSAMTYQPTPSRSRRLLTVVIVLLLVVAGGWWYTQRSTSTAGRGPGGDLAASGVIRNGNVTVSVLVDGWSWATIRGLNPSVNGANEAANLSVPLNAQPITAAQVQWLAAHAPGALALTAGRMLTTAKHVTCSVSGCTSAGGAIPLTWFSDIALVPGWGAMYQRWGITAALYVAPVVIGINQGALSVSVPGWQRVLLGLSAYPGTANESATGWNHDIYLVAGGLGRLFTPDPTWATGSVPWYTPMLAGSVISGEVPLPTTTPFTHGLAVADPAIVTLTDSQLTFLTSPTSGCGFAVCVPGRASVTVTDPTSTSVMLCQGSNRADLAIVSAYWTVHYAHPVNQLYLYGTTNPASFPGAVRGSSLLLAGTPVFAGGTQRLRVEDYLLYSQASASNYQAGNGAGPSDVVGSLFDANHTAERTMTAFAAPSSIYPGWHTC